MGWDTRRVTNSAATFIALAAVLSFLDWVAVGRENKPLEYASKPAATLAFLAVAATLDVPHDASWAWRLAALALCIAGDVFLMLPRDSFIPGLASFAVAQVLFTVSFFAGDTSGTKALLGVVIAVPVAGLLARRFVSAIKRSGHSELVGPVVAYMVVISSMTVGAIASGSALAVPGALVFMASDSLIAETRFVKSRPWHGVGIMVTYHLALAGLTLSLL